MYSETREYPVMRNWREMRGLLKVTKYLKERISPRIKDLMKTQESLKIKCLLRKKKGYL